MTRQRAVPKPHQATMEKKVRRIVRDHGDSMLDPHWPAKHAGDYRVTERTLRQWRRYAMLEGLIPTPKHTVHLERELDELYVDLGMPIPALRKRKKPEQKPADWITGLMVPPFPPSAQ